MTPDPYERVGRLAVEEYRTERGQGARAPEIFKCRRCSALVADTTGKVEHTHWHDEFPAELRTWIIGNMNAERF